MLFSEALTDGCGLWIAAQFAKGGWPLRISTIRLCPARSPIHAPPWFQPAFPGTVEPPALPSHHKALRSGIEKRGETGVCVAGGALPSQARKLNQYLLSCFIGKRKILEVQMKLLGPAHCPLHRQIDSCTATTNAREALVSLCWQRWDSPYGFHH